MKEQATTIATWARKAKDSPLSSGEEEPNAQKSVRGMCKRLRMRTQYFPTENSAVRGKTAVVGGKDDRVEKCRGEFAWLARGSHGRVVAGRERVRRSDLRYDDRTEDR
jgi:hypothetical protein